MAETHPVRLAALANRVAADARYGGAPELRSYSPRERVTEWLQWCDRNGCHTDRAARADGFEPYTLEGAWEALASMLSEC